MIDTGPGLYPFISSTHLQEFIQGVVAPDPLQKGCRYTLFPLGQVIDLYGASDAPASI